MSRGYIEWRVGKDVSKKEALVAVKVEGPVAGAAVDVEFEAQPQPAAPDAWGEGASGEEEVEGDTASQPEESEEVEGDTASQPEESEEEVQESEEEEAWESIDELMAWDPEVVRKYKRRRVASSCTVTRSNDTPAAAKQRKKLGDHNGSGGARVSALLKRLSPCNKGP